MIEPSVAYAAKGIALLEARIAAAPADAASRYELAVLLLAGWGLGYDPDSFDRVRSLLERAITLRPSHAPSHAALGFAWDAADASEPALAAFRESVHLDPRDRICDVYVAMLLDWMGREEEALKEVDAIAKNHRVNLKALRGKLADAGMPVAAGDLLRNGFIRPRNFFRSRLADEEERILNALDRGRARRNRAAEQERIAQDLRDLAARFDASRVPKAFRALAPWASRLGVGDDATRPFLFGQLSRSERNRLVREVDAKAAAIHKWIDTFPEGKMSDEAAAFLYLSLGAEEARELAPKKAKRRAPQRKRRK